MKRSEMINGEGKRLISMFLVLMVVTVLLLPGSALADWRDQATLSSSTSPSKAYIGVETTFTYTLSNTGSSSFDVSDFTVHFDWQQSGYVYDLLDSTVNVPAGSSKSFYVTIAVPQVSIGTHSATISAKGQAVGDWLASTQSWTSNFQVYEIPPLTAVLSANPTSGVASLSVSFTSSVTGGLSPYSYSWSFGDGSSSTQANPTHTFTSAGTYTVKLIVEDSSPTPKVESDTTTITVLPPLTAVLSANPKSGVAPLSVSFTSSVTGGLSPYSYSWSFGDGSSSTQTNPTHTFTSAGTYTVKLIVEDSSPTPKTKSDTTTITISAPSSNTTSSSDTTPPDSGSSSGSGSSGLIGSSGFLILIAIIIIAIIVVLALLHKPKTSQPSQLQQQYPPQQPPQQQYPPQYPANQSPQQQYPPQYPPNQPPED